MGVEDQKIKLVSEDIVREQVILGHNKSPNGDNNYTMTMENSEDILNEIVQSETGIVSARSIKSSDIISENFVPKGSYWLAESCYYDVAIRIISGMTVEKGTGMKYINSAGELEYAHIYTDTINAGGYFGNVQYQSFKSSGACAVIVIYESSLIPDGPWTDNGDGTLTSSTGEIVEIGVTKYGTMQVLKTLGLKPTVGKYNGSWVVIGLDGTKLKLVSKENVGSNITIGYLDSTVNMDEIEEIYNSSNLNLEKAIWSYNHAIDTLNKAAQEQTGIITARSINIEDLESENVLNITEEVKKSSNKNYGRTFKYYYYSDYIYSENIEFDDPNVDDAEENWVERMPDSWNKVEAFVSPEKELIDSNNATRMLKFKCNAYEYGFTDEQKTKFDILLDSDIYWIGSRTISCSCWKNTSGGLGGGQSTINCDFQLYIVNEVGVSRKNIFSGTLKSNYSDSSTGTYGVRAVVSI